MCFYVVNYTFAEALPSLLSLAGKYKITFSTINELPFVAVSCWLTQFTIWVLWNTYLASLFIDISKTQFTPKCVGLLVLGRF